MKLRIFFFTSLASLVLLFLSCSKDVPVTSYKTQNVIVVVVDGARFSETWGEPTHQYIPHRSAMLAQGVFPGHTSICTGVCQNINNAGAEYPAHPSIFQYWLKAYKRPNDEAWIITTKDKLEVLSDCTDSKWKGCYRPMTDCGVNGLGTGYREDSTTFNSVYSKLSSHHLRLTLVNFKQPDAAAHANDSMAYLQGIVDTDEYIYKLWQKIQADEFYKDRTTMIVTNDHGRHTPGHLDGFVSHGDNCDGCRHIEFFAIGPDFKQNFICGTPYEQVDINSTIAELMGFSAPTSAGKVMRAIFKN